MNKALFAGSFNPPTLGHLDIIVRASKLFDQVTIGIACHSQKSSASLFTDDEKMVLLEKMTKGLPNVKIGIIKGLVVNYARENGVTVLIRGIRDASDYAFEARMAAVNKQISDLETLFFVSEPKYSHLSSTLIRELGSLGQSLDGLVPS